MAQSSPTTAAGSSPPSIEVDSALPAASAALQSPFPLGDTPGRPFIRPHRLAQLVPGYAAEEQIEQRLRAGSPKSGAKHVRIDDDPMIGENMWASDEPRVHWTTRLAILAVAFVLSATAAALLSAAGQL